jgi:hypothetical protein
MEKKTIIVDVNTDDGVKSLNRLEASFEDVYGEVQPLTGRIGELEDQLYEMASAGQQGTQEFTQLAAQIGKMKKVIVDVDMAVDGMSGTMSQKLGGSIQGLSGGFELAQGVMGAFGAESAKVEEALLKVNSAMAIAQGVQSVRESIPAFKALNAVLMSNPIGLIVTAFIALSAAAMYFATKANAEVIDAFNKSKAASETYRKQLEKTAQEQNKINDKILKDLDREAARRIAMGEDASKVQREINAEKIKTLEISLEQDKAEVRILNSEKEKLKASQQQTKEKLQQQILAAKQAIIDDKIGVFQSLNIKKIGDALTQIKEIDKETEKQLQATNAQLTLRNQEIEASEDAIDSLKTSQLSLNDAESKGSEDKARQKAAELADEKKFLEEMNQAVLDSNQKSINDRLAAEKALDDQIKALGEQALLDLGENLDKQALIEEEAREKKAAAEKASADKAKALKKEQIDAELNMAKTALGTLGEIADLFAGDSEASQKKAFNVKKAAAIATTTIETYQAAQSAYASQMAITTPDAPIRAAIAAGIAIAQGLVRVASISKTKFQGGGGGASGGGGGGGGAVPSASTPANFNIVGNSNTNQLMEGLQNNPVKTYVVSGDVTSAQSLDRNQIKTATL